MSKPLTFMLAVITLDKSIEFLLTHRRQPEHYEDDAEGRGRGGAVVTLMKENTDYLEELLIFDNTKFQ